MKLQCGKFELALTRPLVMGIVNLTPDSFSGDGTGVEIDRAVAQARLQLAAGADILDLGAESSRPGAVPTPLNEELGRLLPVLQALQDCGVPISIDTYKPEVMRAVLDAGADIINDIWALRQPGALAVVAQHPQCGVCLMHMHRDPQTMQVAPMEGDVVLQVHDFLRGQVQLLQGHGVDASRIVLDPGIGFGKTVQQNFTLLAHQAQIQSIGYPILAGWSRKSSLGAVTGLPVEDRLAPSVAASLLSVDRGARIVRVHDVRETVAALAVWSEMQATN